MNKDAFDVLISEIDKKQAELEVQKGKIKAAQQLMQDIAPRCENCAYFIQHYSAGRHYQRPNLIMFEKLAVGHCTHGRLKNRYRFDTCPNFEPGQKEDYEKKQRIFGGGS